MTGLQLDFLPLITRLGAWLPKPAFSLLHHTLIWFIPCHFVYKDIVGDSGKSLPEAQIHNFQLPPLIHQTSHLDIEGYIEGWFTLRRSMPTIPNHFLVLCLFRSVFQDS